MPRSDKRFIGPLLVWGLLLTLSCLCFVSDTPAQNTQWVPGQITDCDNCTITNLHFDNPTTGWAVGFKPPPSRDWLLFRTDDGGATWKPESIPYTQYLIYQRSRFLNSLEGWSPADSPATRSSIDSIIANGGHYPGEDNTLDSVRYYQTTDGGISWVLREGKVTDYVYLGDGELAKGSTRRYLTAIRFLTPQEGMLAGDVWEYREKDDGTPLFMRYTGRGIYTTQDGGNTWRAFLFGDSQNDQWRVCFEHDLPPSIADIAAVGRLHAWIPALGCSWGTAYLFTTQDGGRSWEVLENSGVRMFGKRVEFVTPAEGWSWGSSGLIRTQDGGNTWVKAENVHGWKVFFISPQEGWLLGASVADDGRYQPNIQHTQDGGQTWQVEYRTPKEQGVTRWETLDELKSDFATQAIWVYGFRALLRRGGVVTGVSPRGKLPVRWGVLKKGE